MALKRDMKHFYNFLKHSLFLHTITSHPTKNYEKFELPFSRVYNSLIKAL